MLLMPAVGALSDYYSSRLKPCADAFVLVNYGAKDSKQLQLLFTNQTYCQRSCTFVSTFNYSSIQYFRSSSVKYSPWKK